MHVQLMHAHGMLMHARAPSSQSLARGADDPESRTAREFEAIIDLLETDLEKSRWVQCCVFFVLSLHLLMWYLLSVVALVLCACV